VGVQVKTVKSLENTCHTWALLRWWLTTKRCYIMCMHPFSSYLYVILYLCYPPFLRRWHAVVPALSPRGHHRGSRSID